MRLFKSVLLAFSFLVVAINANAQLAALDGNWYSTQWKYGYVLKDGVGVATSTNSPNFQVGQNILQLTATSATTFTGQQVYTDGKFYKVNVKLQADGRLYFEGEKNAKWVMDRIGAPPQAGTPSIQSTQTTLSAAGSTSTSPSFDCSKATTPVEKLICTNPELSKLDVGLAEMYKEAVSKDRSIRDDQRAWNVEKNKCTDVDCLKSAYEDRISELTNFIVRHDRAALNQGQASAGASSGVGAQSQASPAIDTNFKLVNGSKEPIFEFFISPVKSTGWGKDILGDAVLMPGFEQPFTAGNSNGCQFDLRVVYGNKGVEEKPNVNLCQLDRIVFDGRASATPTAQTNPAPAPRPAPAPAPRPRDQASEAIKVSSGREWVKGWGRHVKYLNIQSAVDEITISKVVMNRGNCQFRYATTVYGGVNLPARFKFGETVKVDIDHCDLIEAEITTNLGTATYSFRK
jgi:uncharacterized protein